MKRVQALVTALFCVAAAVGISACGASDPNPGGGSARAPSGPFVSKSVVAAMEAATGVKPLEAPATEAVLAPRVAKYQQLPTKLFETHPVSKKATAGKTVALLVCGVPVCAEFNAAAKQAAGVLGWRTVRIDLGVSPEDFANAYDRAIALKPDLVVGSGLPREYFDKQLKELQRMKIPVIEWSSGIKAVKDAIWTTTDTPLVQARGLQMAEYIAADGKLDADTVIFSIKQYASSEMYGHTLEGYLPKICPKCGVEYRLAAATDIGKFAQTVTGYVQRKPDTKYVVCTVADLCQGVGQALRAAGSKVKVVTQNAGSTNYQNIANGTEAATTPLAIGQTGWQIIDLAQRIFNGDDTSDTRLAPLQIITKVPDPKSPLIGAVPDYQAQYRALWKIG